jgi:hypothetical protein
MGDMGSSMVQTSDGDYILAGGDLSDVRLIKIDVDGNKIWERTFDSGKSRDMGTSVQGTTDGGYIIVGTSGAWEGNSDIWIIKTDANGNKLWDRIFDGGDDDWGNSIQQTSDGGYIVLGTMDSPESSDGDTHVSTWLIKIDADGSSIWQKTFEGSWSNNVVQQTSDGGYIILGPESPDGLRGSSFCDAWLTKTDANGNILWTKSFGGEGNEWSHSYEQTTDANGNRVLVKTFGADSCDRGNSIQQTRDEGFIITGQVNANGAGNGDVWLLKTDADGNKLWDKIWELGSGASVHQTNDGGYIIAGSTEGIFNASENSGDAWFIKTDANGNELWNKTFGGPERDWANSVQPTSDGGYILEGGTWSFGAWGDAWLIKVAHA